MFSFILPCFNRTDILRLVLTSFRYQTANVPFEVILVDNNSTEAIDEVHQSFLRHMEVYLIHQPRLENTFALCRARNIGLQLARYPWTVLLDSDCALNRQYLRTLEVACRGNVPRLPVGERIFSSAEGLSEDVLMMDHRYPNALGRIRSPSNYYQLKDRRLPHMRRLPACEQPWAYAHGGNCVFRTGDASKVNGFAEEYDGCWGYEDIDFAYRLATQCRVPVAYCKGLEVFHLEHGTCEGIRLDERFDKSKNRNWSLICNRIPGFREFKERQYSSISADIGT